MLPGVRWSDSRLRIGFMFLPQKGAKRHKRRERREKRKNGGGFDGRGRGELS